jgi:hypothetical protein
MFFKHIFALLIVAVFATSSSYCLSDNDSKSPEITIISPHNAQQYIVSKPTIRAKFNDDSCIDLKSIKLYLNYKDVTKDCLIDNNSISYKPTKKLKRGTQIVKIQINDLNKNKSNIEWYFNVGTPNYNHYYGLLHAHTSNSDGNGSFEDAYYSAKFNSKLDFFAITEHSNMLDNYINCNLNDSTSSTKWNDLIKVAKDYNSNGNFLAIRGFEMTYPYENVKEPIGHINVFNTLGFISTNNSLYSDLNNFYKTISKEDDLIAQFNHPCDVFGRFNNFKYNSEADSVISLIEVCNGYYKDINKNKLSFEDYQKALDLGWHLGPTANQDNHIKNWGVANEFRTVVLCTDLNESAFYDSLKNMRVYATQDKNIKIDYTINDEVMGSTIKNTSNLYFNISVVDNDFKDKIQRIDVVSNNGKIIASKNFNSNLAKLEFKFSNLKDSYYYIKVYQNNNKVSVTAPIWVELNKK